MERNTNRLIALVTQILDFRQTETRGFSLDFTRITLQKYCRIPISTSMPWPKRKIFISL